MELITTPSHNSKTFEVMTLTLPLVTLGSVGALLAAILYQGNPGMYHNLRKRRHRHLQ
jgi:hypothetical protein